MQDYAGGSGGYRVAMGVLWMLLQAIRLYMLLHGVSWHLPGILPCRFFSIMI
jgi:hypothetical protein